MNDIEASKSKLESNLAKVLVKNFEEQNINCFFSAFQEYFDNRSDFDDCLINLKEKKNEIARLGFFYYVVTKEIRHAGITLISIFSIMEATSQKDFKTFDQWLLSKIKKGKNISFPVLNRDSFKKLILSFQKEYFKKNGSSEKVRKFINDYFSTEDKQRLISGFRIQNKGLDFDSFGFDDKVRVIVDMLYEERNAFVHQARLPQILDQKVKMIGYCKVKKKNTPVSIEISITEIQKMFERAFINILRNTNS